MSKPSTPVRRSKVGPGRPGSAGGEIPLTASMEVLTPDPSCVPQIAAAMDVGRSTDLSCHVNGSKPRAPGSAPLTRTRSTDGRRSGLLSGGPHMPLHHPHEVIPLTSTTAKSLTASTVSTILPGHPAPLSLYTSRVGGGAGLAMPVQAWGLVPVTGGHAEVISSQSSLLRYNPVTEGEDDAGGDSKLQRPQSQPVPQSRSLLQLQTGEADTGSAAATPTGAARVVVGGSAANVAQRAASAAAGGSSRRYAAAAESVAMSQQPGGPLGGAGAGGGGDGGVAVSSSGVFRPGGGEEAELPGTPGSVASGRVGGGGGVFFTDLHRSFGDGSRLRLRDSGVGDSQDLTGALALDEEGARHRRTRASALLSRLNPMQSPSSSEDGGGPQGEDEDADFAEYAGEEPPPPQQPADGSTALGGGADGMALLGEASTSALTEYANPLQTPQDSRLATPLLPVTADATSATAAAVRSSLLHVIHDLYVTNPDTEPTPQPQDEEEEGPVREPSRPATAVSVAPTEPEAEAEADGASGADALAASRAAVAALAHSESQQSKRRSELGEYMTALQGLKDDSGGSLVELPVDWGVMLERLFRQRKAEFATLQGWMGPHRFEDLPINQLPSEHPDPREEGLARIRELDSVLNDKLIAALISHRETFPNQWAEQERKRLERHSKGVEEALKRERQKRLRAARISRAVTSLDGPADPRESQGSLQSLAEQPSSVYSRLFTLKPEEEALVEHVMQRNDDEGAAINPFDLESAAAYGNVAAAAPAATPVAKPPPAGAGARGAAPNIVVTDPDDIDLDLELDMLLPSSRAVSCCATPSGLQSMRPSTAGMRPLSARAGDHRPTDGSSGAGGSGTVATPPWAGAGDTSRPQSAMSDASFVLSRPGTAGSVGGMSAIAAAALRGHPALRHAWTASGSGAGAGSGLLPARVYEDPRAAARALRAINARLAAFESEHLWDENGALADFKSIAPAESASTSASQGLGKAVSVAASTSAASASAAGAGSAGASAAAPRAVSPTRSVRSGAGGGGGPPESVSGISVTEGGQRDYIREERLAKELASRERDLDAALRRLKTGEVVKLGEVTLKALVEQCRRLQELNEHRRQIEEAEVAARKAQQLRQQALAANANGRGAGSPRGTSKGGTTPKSGTASGTAAASSPHAPSTSTSSTAATSTGPTTNSGSGGTAASSRSNVKGPPAGPSGRPAAGATSTSPDVSAPAGPRAGAAGRAAAGAGHGGATYGGSQRHNSAGSSGARSGSAGAERSHQGSAGAAAGAAGAAVLAPSRRASDPAMSPSTSGSSPAVAGGSKATASGAAAAGKAGGTSAPQGPLARAGAGASAHGGTPPKAKPAVLRSSAGASVPGLSASTTPTAGAAAAASTSSSAVFSSLADIGGLPPPPPPPPP